MKKLALPFKYKSTTFPNGFDVEIFTFKILKYFNDQINKL